MSNNFTRVLTLLLVAVVSLGAMSGAAAALETTSDTDVNVAGSDLVDNSTVDGFNASGDAHSILELKTPEANTTDALTIELSAENETHLTLDDLDEEYSIEESVDTTDDATPDSDVHTFNISHNSLETVPVEANGETPITIDVTYEYTDGSDTAGTASMSIDATLNATGDRTVLYITDDNLDNDDRGGAVSTEDVEPSTIDKYLRGAETTTQYTLDDDLAVDGDNTTVTVYMNGDMADAYAESVSDDSESEDLILTQTTTVDDSVAPTFDSAANTDLVADASSYGVYKSSGTDSLTLTLGENVSDSDSITVMSTNTKAGDLGDSVTSQSLFDAYSVAELGLSEAFSAFGFKGLGISLGIESLVFGLIPVVGLGGR